MYSTDDATMIRVTTTNNIRSQTPGPERITYRYGVLDFSSLCRSIIKVKTIKPIIDHVVKRDITI